MAKLSKKITDNQNENQKNIKKLSTLSTKIDKTNNNEENIPTKTEQENSIDTKELTELIISKITLDNVKIEDLKNLLAKVDLQENELQNFLRSKVISEDLKNTISDKLKELQNKINELENENKKLDAVNKKLDTYVSNLKTQIDDSEEEVFKIKKQYENVIPVSELTRFFINEKINNFYTQKLITLIEEAYLSGDENAKKFVMSFLKNFVLIENAIMSLGDEDSENMELLYEAGNKLLKNIAGLYASERRMILDTIADMFTASLQTYKFISPEQTLQIDPQIHNAEGLGGNIIRYGLTFAVVRKETDKTVHYADVITQ